MEDKQIICKDCGKTFVHSVRDQEFYKEQGFNNEPIRCRDCRIARKQSRNSKPLANRSARNEVKEAE